MKDISITHASLIDDTDLRSQVADLINEVTAHTGISPLSEQFVLGLDDPRLGHQHLVAHVDGELSGAIAIDKAPEVPVAEVVVRGEGRREAQALVASVQQRPVDVWSHGPSPVADLPDADKVRELLVMSLRERIETVPISAGYEILTLAQSRERWGSWVDEEFLRVNNEAFSWHPEQGGWDLGRWERAQEAVWFDPEGVFLLWGTPIDVSEKPIVEKTMTLMGFHWTKCARSRSVNAGENLGEVYVVGLANAARGRGLGRFLTVTGVKHLQESGCDQVILYVEADNIPAVSVYEKLGFAVTERHVLYRFSHEN